MSCGHMRHEAVILPTAGTMKLYKSNVELCYIRDQGFGGQTVGWK